MTLTMMAKIHGGKKIIEEITFIKSMTKSFEMLLHIIQHGDDTTMNDIGLLQPSCILP